MTRHYVRLVTSEPNRRKFRGKDVFVIEVTAAEAINMPTEIFLWQKSLFDARTQEQHDDFVTFCSVYDLTAYAANAPAEDQNPPYFRLDTALVRAPKIDQCDAGVEFLKAGVRRLCLLLDELENMEVVADNWYPEDPPDDEESSTPEP